MRPDATDVSPGAPTLHVYYDLGSPYSYLSWRWIRDDPEAWDGVNIIWHPVSAGHIFKAEGGKPNMEHPNLATYHLLDVERWADELDVPYAEPSTYPQRTIEAMRVHHALVLGERLDDALRWSNACFVEHWTDDADLSDPPTLQRIADALGLKIDTATMAADTSAKEALIRATDQAHAAGAPGVPFFVAENAEGVRDIFWGNDRLEWAHAFLFPEDEEEDQED